MSKSKNDYSLLVKMRKNCVYCIFRVKMCKNAWIIVWVKIWKSLCNIFFWVKMWKKYVNDSRLVKIWKIWRLYYLRENVKKRINNIFFVKLFENEWIILTEGKLNALSHPLQASTLHLILKQTSDNDTETNQGPRALEVRQSVSSQELNDECNMFLAYLSLFLTLK